MPKIRPLREINNVTPFLAMQGVTAADAPRAVYDAAQMAVVVATEMMSPSLLGLSRKLKNGSYEEGGWRLRSYPTSRPLNEYFILEETDGQGGYLFNIRLRPRKTDAALEAMSGAMRPTEKALLSITDPNASLAARKDSILNPAPEVLQIAEDPASYLPDSECTEIEHIVCCAFATDGVSPRGFDDEVKTPFELVTTAALGPDPLGHMPGRVFAVRPDPVIDFDENPDVPLSRSVDDIGASLSVLSTIGAMLPGTGFAFAVRKRTADMGRLSYNHYGPRTKNTLLELAAVSVYRDGGVVGRSTINEMLQIWHHACNRIVSESAVPLSSALRLLREDGHVDPDNSYAAYGDLLHVQETSSDAGILFVTTSHNAYRVDFKTDDDGMVTELYLTIPAEDGTVPGPEDTGFLGSYRISSHGGILSSTVSEQGFFRGNSMRALNDMMESVGMAAEALADDRTRRYTFAY